MILKGNSNTPKSDLSKIKWPAVPNEQISQVLALEYQLQQTQWYSPEELSNHQALQLLELLGHARMSVPFYKERLNILFSGPGGEIGLDNWFKIPVLTREELQSAGELLLSNQLPSDHGDTRQMMSSGSTGRPTNVRITHLSGLFFAALNLRNIIWHGLDFKASVCAVRPIRQTEEDNAAKDKPIPWVPAHDSGPMYLFDVTRPMAEQISWLVERNPDYLLTLPSNLGTLVQRVERENLKLPKLKAIMTMSEMLPPGLRQRCQDVLGAPILDSYSSVELGMIALQCPDHSHYHVQSENVVVEILNEEGEPCKAGEMGRIVVTDLHNFAMPLIRYDLGDYAEVGTSCPCGRGLPVLNRIQGRYRNMITLPSGDKAWPLPWFSDELIPLAPIRQIQLTQHTTEEIEVKLVMERHLHAAEEQALSKLLLHRLHHPFTFLFTYVDEIPRSKSGKFEDFVSLLD